MTSRRPGWALHTAAGVLVSGGVPIGWSLTRPALPVGAGIAESLADSTSIATVPTRTASPSVPALPTVPITEGRSGVSNRNDPKPVRLELPSFAMSARVTPVPEDDP